MTEIPAEDCMCDALTPKGFRGDRPGWWYCARKGRQVDPRRCLPEHCKDHSMTTAPGGPESEDTMADEVRRNWRGPARDVWGDDAPDGMTAVEYAVQIHAESGYSGLVEASKRIGCNVTTVLGVMQSWRDALKKQMAEEDEATPAGDEATYNPPKLPAPPKTSTVKQKPVHRPAPAPKAPAPVASGRPACTDLAREYIIATGQEAAFGRYVLGISEAS